jgi:hypothetical protein
VQEDEDNHVRFDQVSFEQRHRPSATLLTLETFMLGNRRRSRERPLFWGIRNRDVFFCPAVPHNPAVVAWYVQPALALGAGTMASQFIRGSHTCSPTLWLARTLALPRIFLTISTEKSLLVSQLALSATVKSIISIFWAHLRLHLHLHCRVVI